jgi:enterochelin esterase-like enzyme
MSGVLNRVGAFAREHVREPRHVSSRARGAWRPGTGLVLGVAVIVALRLGGVISGSDAALEEIGFDPDRALLITGLTVGGLAAGLSALITGRRAAPMLVAYLGLAAVFGSAFLAETSAAVATTGPDGFRPLGWLATFVTLLAAGLVTGWALATLALEVRRWILLAIGLAGAVTNGARPGRGRLARVLAPVVAVVVVAGSLPTLGDMINYTPDVAMTGGGMQQAPPLVGGTGSSTAGAAPGESGGGSAATGQGGPGGQAPAPTVTPGSIASTQPWSSHPPVGQGSVVSFSLPSPWSAGNVTASTVWVYLPAGYRGTTARYPVVYTVPWDLAHWTMGIHVTALLDQAISNGSLPPEIVVFANLAGGPFPNSECADSFDGREHADTFVSSTLVRYLDAHYRTIANAGARTIAGFSQGGFCAANLLMRHPDVFHQAVIFAGYFEAGLSSGETVNSWMPFGHVAAVVAANSPMQTAGELPASVRAHLFVVMSAQPDLGVFGQQASQFARVLARTGIAADLIWNQLGHAWKAVRMEFVPALQAVAEREVRTGALP